MDLRIDREKNNPDAGEHALPLTGGGGNTGGMEARVTALEARMGRVEEKIDRVEGKLDAISKTLADMRGDLSYLSGKVDSLPTTIQLLGFAIAIIVASGLVNWAGR